MTWLGNAQRKLWVLMLLIAGIVAAGCSDPKVESEGNFRNAINKHLDKDSLFMGLSENYEFGLPSGTKRVSLHNWQATDVKEFVDYLDKQGYVFNVTTPGSESQVYELQKSFIEESRPKLLNGTYKFYLGTIRVDEILEWTKPGDFFGSTVTKVKYSRKLIDVPKWAQPFVEKRGYMSEDSNHLVLTNKGWRVER